MRVVAPAEKIVAEPAATEEKTPPPVDMTFYEGSSDTEPAPVEEPEEVKPTPVKTVETGPREEDRPHRDGA